MQKRTSWLGWSIVVGLIVLATLTLRVPVSGLDYVRDHQGCGGPILGGKPLIGLRGANDGGQCLAGGGPVEHLAPSEVGRGFTDVARQREARWASFLNLPRDERH